MTAPDAPRTLDPAATFAAMTDWIADQSRREGAPGLIVGLSGTDSLLTFMACARAFAAMGRPERVLGVHYEHAPAPDALTPAFNHFAGVIAPWLAANAPGARVEIDRSLPENDDNKRWGALFSRAVADTGAGRDLHRDHYFVVGTRNATEQALGTYSQISKSVSMLPIVDLYKSEVLDICRWLNVPQSAIDSSCETDCACGRFDTQARYMQELDWLLMQKAGLLSRAGFEARVPEPARAAVREFYVEETVRNDFRLRTPYRPAQPLVRTIA